MKAYSDFRGTYYRKSSTDIEMVTTYIEGIKIDY